MDRRTYALAASAEERHWWFRGRRAILASVLRRYVTTGRQASKILEVGCGNGGNLALLARFGAVYATEVDEDARMRAARRGFACVERGWLPDGLPFGELRFDVIAVLDVLEHVDDDRRAVAAVRERMSRGGILVVTVPAYGWLWSEHDELSHHRRRYTLRQMRDLLRAADLRLFYATYFNTLLFPIAVCWTKLGGTSAAAMAVPPRPLNRLLETALRLEGAFVPQLSLPYGMSILACASLDNGTSPAMRPRASPVQSAGWVPRTR